VTALPQHRRLFIALDLPGDVRTTLGRMGDRIAAETGAVAVPRENLHITLAFLGNVRREIADHLVTDLFDACCGTAHRARLGDVVARPRPARARLVAVEIADLDGTIARQADRIRRVVRPLIAGDPDDRPLWPHVTVARLRRPSPVRGFPQVDDEHVFAIDRVTLYDSVTSPTGPPTYRSIMTVPLSKPPERNVPDG